MINKIQNNLAEIEKVEGIKIIFACESGSRAWGFPSADSDYDVRFIYLHPLYWYLSINNKPDVIELPIKENLDINGWDLRKALQLFKKSNPPLYEWLGSPIIYTEQFNIASQLRQLALDFYSPLSCTYHYLHMAQGNYREYLKGERVWIKKYFYVLRPILAINWINRNLGLVPTEFNTLVNGLELETNLKAEINKLLEAKRAGAELDYGPRIDCISDFIEKELSRLESMSFNHEKPTAPSEILDALFQKAFIEVWPDRK